MESFKIKVTPEQSRIVQEEMFKRGYEWSINKKAIANTLQPHLYFYPNYKMACGSLPAAFSHNELYELTFNEFKTKYLNNMKEFKIEVPKGYEIDKEKSTFERIVFKEANKLPQSWEELGMITGAYILSHNSSIAIVDKAMTNSNGFKNIFPTRTLAEAALAMAQLLQLRDRWNDGWVPDWTDGKPKWCIVNKSTALTVDAWAANAHPISFKTKELAEQFFAAPKIRELLEIAKPLL